MTTKQKREEVKQMVADLNRERETGKALILSGRYGYTAIDQADGAGTRTIETGMTLNEVWYFLRGMIAERNQRNDGTAVNFIPQR